jgi:hypothetical protein
VSVSTAAKAHRLLRASLLTAVEEEKVFSMTGGSRADATGHFRELNFRREANWSRPRRIGPCGFHFTTFAIPATQR